jgi:hypothetical protein
VKNKQQEEKDDTSLYEQYDKLTDQMGKQNLSSLNTYLIIILKKKIIFFKSIDLDNS